MARRPRVSTRLAFRLAWVLVAVVPACAASQEWIYEKPRVTPAQLDHDKAACRKIAPSRSLFRLLETDRVEREAFNTCMQRRGYSVTVVPTP